MAAFATGVPPDIYGFHSYTWNSATLSRYSSLAVSKAVPQLGCGISPLTYQTAYVRFSPVIPINACPPYYRGCWHGVSRCFLWGYRQALALFTRGGFFPLTEVYDPRTFIPHAASLRQAFAHCAIFPTAASPRSLDRVPVPVWPVILSDRLPIVALVGRYPAN